MSPVFKAASLAAFTPWKASVRGTDISPAEGIFYFNGHHTISFTDSKIRTTFNVSITDSGSERFNCDFPGRRNDSIYVLALS